MTEQEQVDVEVKAARISYGGRIYQKGETLKMPRAEALACFLSVRIVEDPKPEPPVITTGTLAKVDGEIVTIITSDGRLVEVRVPPAAAKAIQTALEPPAPKPKGKPEQQGPEAPEPAEIAPSAKPVPVLEESIPSKKKGIIVPVPPAE